MEMSLVITASRGRRDEVLLERLSHPTECSVTALEFLAALAVGWHHLQCSCPPMGFVSW